MATDDTIHDGHDCGGCELASAGRRTFLREAAAAAVAAMLAVGATAGAAQAMPLRFATRLGARDAERRYAIPAADGAEIDAEEGVIVTRWRGTVVAFSLACPHQNTALRWNARVGEFQCPKHRSRYQPDGTFIEGRATRGMDRFAIRRDGDAVLVDLDTLVRVDRDAAAWRAAVVTL